MDEKRETPLPAEAEETAVAAAEPSPLPENPDAPDVADLPADAGGEDERETTESYEQTAVFAAEPSPLSDNPDAPPVADLPTDARGEAAVETAEWVEQTAVSAAEPSSLSDTPDAPPVADLPADAGGEAAVETAEWVEQTVVSAAEPSPLSDNPDAPPVADLPTEAGGHETGTDDETQSAEPDEQPADQALGQEMSAEAEQFLMAATSEDTTDDEATRRVALLEAIVYVTDEPLSAEQIAKAMDEPLHDVRLLLDRLVDEYNKPHHGLTVKEVAGGYKMATKPEHHEAVRAFVKNLNPPLKLSLAALETLAVIAYKQPITAPEIMEVRGVQGAGVLKTLIDRKLITTAGRKNVVGKPILYKTTKEFLVQFGLRDLNELPTLKEFEDLRRLAFTDGENEQDGSTPDAAPAP